MYYYLHVHGFITVATSYYIIITVAIFNIEDL